jgi:putative transposase
MMKLNIKNRCKRRIPKRVAMPLSIPEHSNHTWSVDFMSDSLYSGRRFRTLNILDDYNREALYVEVSNSIPAYHVIEKLELLLKERDKPKQIRVDNGPEFVSATFVDWCNKNKIAIQYIQPGRPMQNGLIERFNRSYRTEVLDAHIFYTINQAREITNEWVDYYNNERPHDSLNNLPPCQYKVNQQNNTFVV